MLVTTLNGATEPHPTVQESDAESKTSTSETLQQSAKDLPNLETGNAVHIQLVPNVRKWVPGTIIDVISSRSYKVKTILGGVYIKSWKFIKIRHTDLRQSLQTTQESATPNMNKIYRNRPKRVTRKPQRLIESINFIWIRNTQRRFM